MVQIAVYRPNIDCSLMIGDKYVRCIWVNVLAAFNFDTNEPKRAYTSRPKASRPISPVVAFAEGCANYGNQRGEYCDECEYRHSDYPLVYREECFFHGINCLSSIVQLSEFGNLAQLRFVDYFDASSVHEYQFFVDESGQRANGI